MTPTAHRDGSAFIVPLVRVLNDLPAGRNQRCAADLRPVVAQFDKLANRHTLESVSQRLILTKGANMIRFNAKSASLISALLCVLATPVLAESGDTTERGAGSMTGYQETPAAINSPGSGEFFIHVHPDRTALDYELRYRGLTGVTQAHIHFGRPGVTGGIVLYLCSNLAAPAGVPVPQTCPTSEGILTGTLTAANIVAQTAQGITAGDSGFQAILKAIQEGATYANVHTTGFPGGEIRGGIRARGPFFN